MKLLVAIVVSVLVIAAGPIMGGVRAALQSAFPERYIAILVGAVAVGVGAAIFLTVIRIRQQRVLRYGAIALAVAIGVAYSTVTAVPQAEINAVERVHFLEYGLIGLLFYRVWKPSADSSMVVLPLLASVIVGTMDEWVQWFVPVRVGEARDVALNIIAVACGVLFGFAFSPPAGWSWMPHERSRRSIWFVASLTTVLFAAFFATVHLGHVVYAEGIGEFRSHYSAGELERLALDRQTRWEHDPPLVFRRFSREDQYMDEGLWHIRRRNGLWAANDFTAARRENMILERFFRPVLDTRSYALPQGGRWPAAQQADAEARADHTAASFVSDAEPYTMVTWPKSAFWLTASALALLLFALGLRAPSL